MSMDCALYAGSVMHVRLRPRVHRLRYRMYSLLLDLDALPQLSARMRLFSLNRFNLFSVHERDHGGGTPNGLAAWVRAQLRDASLPADGAIHLFTMPRILGYAFNPLSVYFCHDAAGALRAILYEVNNTFGERHCYLLDVADEHAGEQPTRIRQRCAKQFHVSPFLAMNMEYRFRVHPPRADSDDFGLVVDVHDEGGRLLLADYTAQRRTLNDAALLRVFFSHPLLTLKVIAGIHWEALRLWLKGIRIIAKPTRPPVSITTYKTGN